MSPTPEFKTGVALLPGQFGTCAIHKSQSRACQKRRKAAGRAATKATPLMGQANDEVIRDCKLRAM